MNKVFKDCKAQDSKVCKAQVIKEKKDFRATQDYKDIKDCREVDIREIKVIKELMGLKE